MAEDSESRTLNTFISLISTMDGMINTTIIITPMGSQINHQLIKMMTLRGYCLHRSLRKMRMTTLTGSMESMHMMILTISKTINNKKSSNPSHTTKHSFTNTLSTLLFVYTSKTCPLKQQNKTFLNIIVLELVMEC